MDISTEHVQMCRKAKEIQIEWRLLHGDFVIRKDDKINGVYVWCKECSVTLQKYLFWLPSQDQLQAMVIGEYSAASLTQRFGAWVCTEHGIDRGTASMEGLWLAYVMWVKFGKVWDSTKEEWVKK